MVSSTSFKTNYVLIDYENVQPNNLSLLTEPYFQVYLFLGAKQTRLNLNLVAAMHEFGPIRSKYIHVSQTRPNALDFHITYYLGQFVEKNPTAYFHVISKDKGFEPLIEHLNTLGIKAHRRDSIADIPVLNISENANIDEKFHAIIKNLKGRGQSRPRKEKTLKNTISTAFKEKLTSPEVISIFQKLEKSNYIVSKDGKITYALPK